MSNPENFIEEVTEEVRRDQLFMLFRRYGWIAVVAVLLLVGGAAFNEWRKAKTVAASQELGDAMLAALEANEPAERVTALEAIEASGNAEALVEFLAAGEELAGEDPAAAAARFAVIAENNDLPLAYRQLATLKQVFAQGATVAGEERLATLSPLTAPGQPFRALAEEQSALIEAELGQTDAAIERLRELLTASDATAGLRQRASQLIVALGGSLEGL
ncbi:hypothetical protein [Actibacterium lipolyticum]|uniref:Tetratricopeptide repeat-like domain-containing protein n=1 Tax=Actibacterium lipolyticum TaxID=1524263 RepID=A0A238JV34_9RHOB|nr:hypothetical protein [Actibacterium lipolyticum]SMX34455.1 hypothetical protein COL8621_01318 [Actibacterium lipolyticum]